jgi:hypothetical protein
MATAEKNSSQLRITFYDGEDPKTGDSIYKKKSFNSVKTDADADQLYTIATTLSALQARTLYAIERLDSTAIRDA